MKRRLICLILGLCLLVSALPTASAAEFTDLEGHWAEGYIYNATEMGLFQGISETEFDPDGTMTRGMFVTVLGRMEGVDTEFWSSEAAPIFFKQDVDELAYYAPYVSWAVCNGIVNGMNDVLFAPNDPITREQMAKLVCCYLERMGYTLTPLAEGTTVPKTFSDAEDIAPWAADYVDLMRSEGILGGSPDEDGNLQFLPRDSLTRGECAAVLCRILERLEPIFGVGSVPAESIAFEEKDVRLSLGETYELLPKIMPAEAQPQLVWRSSDSEIFSVDQEGLVTCLAEGEAVISVYTGSGLFAQCSFSSNMDLASADETYEEKCMRVFGEVVEDPKYYYAIYDENGNYVDQDYERAREDLVEITVDVWDLRSDGSKYTRQFTILVHKNLKETYIQIFKEIYEGEEQFPIHYLSGFNKAGRSEHTLGLAVDINPNENYYYNYKTGEQVGEYWKPGEDPYSIPLDGEVARIFNKYGFKQGIWRNSVDYMHFSYFGT